MISNQGNGDFKVTCDGNCGKEREYWADNNWKFLMKEMFKDGWKNINKNGLWHHYCKECKTNLK